MIQARSGAIFASSRQLAALFGTIRLIAPVNSSISDESCHIKGEMGLQIAKDMALFPRELLPISERADADGLFKLA